MSRGGERVRRAGSLTNAIGALLFARGLFLVLAALVVVRWPEETIVTALVLVGVFSVATGLADIVTALRGWFGAVWSSLGIVHGIAFVIFGLLTASIPALRLRGGLLAAAAWLAAGAVTGFVLSSARARHGQSVTWTLGWAVVHVVLAAVALGLLAQPGLVSSVALLYGGAAYAGLLGAAEGGIGLWLHRIARGHSSLATHGPSAA